LCGSAPRVLRIYCGNGATVARLRGILDWYAVTAYAGTRQLAFAACSLGNV